MSSMYILYLPGRRGNKTYCLSVSMCIQRAYDDNYLPEPLESCHEHEGLCSLRAPRHVRYAHFFTIAINVLNQRPIVHHKARSCHRSQGHDTM